MNGETLFGGRVLSIKLDTRGGRMVTAISEEISSSGVTVHCRGTRDSPHSI